MVARHLTTPGGVHSIIFRIVESSKDTSKFDDATATKFLMHPLFSGCTSFTRANRRVAPIRLVTSGLHEGTQSPTIERWMRTELNPVDPRVFS
jgi:hypothetical protein